MVLFSQNTTNHDQKMPGTKSTIIIEHNMEMLNFTHITILNCNYYRNADARHERHDARIQCNTKWANVTGADQHISWHSTKVGV